MNFAPVVLPCEKRKMEQTKDVCNLIPVEKSTSCEGKWQRHTYSKSETKSGITYLLYACNVCGHERVYGNLA